MNETGKLRQLVIKATHVVIHPLSIALVLTTGISLLFLPKYGKYDAEIIEHTQMRNSGVLKYEDLDGNGYSDRIITFAHPNGINCLTVLFEPSVFIQEWDFRGCFRFETDSYVLAGDYDENNLKELYIFTVSGDSILLNTITDLFSKVAVLNTRFIARVGDGCDSIHAGIVAGTMDDLNGDRYKEVIFAVNAGYSLTPRQVFAFDVKNDTVYASPDAGYSIGKLIQADITGDGKNEIILNGYASQNINDPDQQIGDKHCWLIVLDNNLNYLFPPVPFPDTGYSNLTTLAIPNGSGYSDLYSVFLPSLVPRRPAQFIHFSKSGRILRKEDIDTYSYDKIIQTELYQIGDRFYIGLSDNQNRLYLHDKLFNTVNQMVMPCDPFRMHLIDLNGDQRSESIFIDPFRNKILVYTQGMEDPVEVSVNLDIMSRTTLSINHVPGEQDLLVIDSGVNNILIKYFRNPMYFFQYLITGGFYLIFLLLILFIRWLTKVQIRKRYETESKITELQLKIVKNQMDPHFTMNAINSVMAAVQKDEKDAATQSLVHFARIFRAMVLSGDKIERTLAEEIDFVRNYLDLERFRFRNIFEYEIVIDADVNLDWKVPKMILQSPAENAVKHGLLPKSTGGRLTIRVYVSERQLVLEVGDNGVGRTKAARIGSDGTQKGLSIMKEFLDLYEKIKKIHIDWKIIDLISSSGEPLGTKVIILVPVQKR